MSDTPIDLSQLPPPEIIEPLDYETLFIQRKAALIALYPVDQQAEIAATLALESEPLTLLLQENAYRELLLRQRINEAARAGMLAFAVGTDLDHLAANFGVKRLPMTPGDPQAQPPLAPTWESDARLRERTQLAFQGLSTAGPRGAYLYHARAADGRITDASVISPRPAEVVVTVLATPFDAALLSLVERALNAETVRPIGDRLTVQAAHLVPYRIEARLHLTEGPAAEPILPAARERLSDYIQAQHRLGRDIRRSAIFAVLHGEGVEQVELFSPAEDIILNETQAGHCTHTTLTVAQRDEY
jgi:phage-related baseplate assembly protein